MNDSDVTRDTHAKSVSPGESAPLELPKSVGRYRVENVLGQGGFGIVYLARDEQLDRPVAVKVPHAKLVHLPAEAEAYLAEARIVANLDHPNIVPVYDVGSTEQFPCFIVSRYIDGTDLSTKLKQHRIGLKESVELVAAVAEALHYAHKQGLVHRDVKPGNILIGTNGKPYVVDFGLALSERNIGRGPKYAGTPTYMSPEQARGEGHRVDGRSDIFSLGSMMYELLTGEQPFQSHSTNEVLHRIKHNEPRPLRQRDDRIPNELQRICLKALSKRVADRYITALDMADELRSWLSESPSGESPETVAAPSSSMRPVSGSVATTPVLPKGLRSFDANDSDFFLQLLPGPRDRYGIPESIRFWKSRIEERDGHQTFSVGVIYGPSGSGKSSLLKAGLLPLLDEGVEVIYAEAAADTEERLLRLLRLRFPNLEIKWSLADSLAAIRRGEIPETHTKALIVLDQFEQWLNLPDRDGNQELVEALRQCDGSKVQAILCVRDDFWMGISRLTHDLEIDLVPGDNVAPIDLLGSRHARKILRSFGTALGALPENDEELTVEQNDFLDQMIDDLSEDNKVMPVQLSLYTEMVKDRSWSPATLRDVGGTAGIGVAFLEDTFGGRTANPQHRIHEKAARAVLAELLPQDGGSIKGSMRSYEDLFEVSGYTNQPIDFKSLLRVLDNDLRLITPTESDASTPENGSADLSRSRGQRYYHLTHDYLVTPLRDWLQQKQKESRRGRTLLRLDERAEIWDRQRTGRQLPSLPEWLGILLFTKGADRRATRQRRQLLAAANRHYGLQLVAVAAVLLIVGWAGIEWNGSSKASAYVNALKTARISDVPIWIDKLQPYRRWADPLLVAVHDQSDPTSPERLHSCLALASRDRKHQQELSEWLFVAEPRQFPVISNALKSMMDGQDIVERLSIELHDPNRDGDRRFRAGVALAQIQGRTADRGRDSWEPIAPFLADRLVRELDEHPENYQVWVQSLKPIGDVLAPSLSSIFVDEDRTTPHRNLSASLLVRYASSDTARLVDLALNATPTQFERISPALENIRSAATPSLEQVIQTAAGETPVSEQQKDVIAKRRAHAAGVLLKWDRPLIARPLLISGSDNRLRSYLIRRATQLRVDPQIPARVLKAESNASVRAALLLILGGTKPSDPAQPIDPEVIAIARDLYVNDKTSAVHSSAEWALRQWEDDEWLRQTQLELASWEPRAGYQWFVIPEGITMAIVQGPVTVRLGSPQSEFGRDGDESFRTRHLNRTFAISTTEITKEQFLRFAADAMPQGFKHGDNPYIPEPNCPINAVQWYDSAAYCRWISERAGIPDDQMCYPSIVSIPRMQSLPDECLRKTSYRLPTEAEWEYVCRAGTTTPRPYGYDPELLGEYVWYFDNAKGRSWPVGSLRPNAWGFFDMQGNVSEWCHDLYQRMPATVADDADQSQRVGQRLRVTKGGGYSDNHRTLRAANRRNEVPFTPGFSKGFRIAKTLEVVN